MLKEMYHQYRYKRLLLFDADPQTRCLQLLERYHRLCRMVSFNKVGYRRRIRYSIATKTRSLGELLDLLKTVINHIEAGSIDLDTLPAWRAVRKTTSVDMWLVDKEQVAFEEDRAVTEILRLTEELVKQLTHLRNKKPSLYTYYNQNMQFVLYDVLEVLDAMLAMQLSVDRIATIKTLIGN